MAETVIQGWTHLEETQAIPLSWYLDPAILEAEQKELFDAGPGFVGHELLVPEDSSYHVLSWEEGWALVRDRGEVHLMSNVCRHRQSIILEGRGPTKSIVCPLHRWSYGLDGRQKGAPRFGANPGRDLETRRLQTWNGLLFTGPRDVASDLAGFSFAPEFDFTGYVYDRTWVEEYPINWKTFIEFYIELYHVEPFHPGLAGFVDSNNFTSRNWEFGKWWANQRVAPGPDLTQSRSDAYLNYQKLIVDYRGEAPKFGAIWFCYYPNIMVEWYPEALLVSHVVPHGVSRSTNVVDFFYPEEVMRDAPEIAEAHQRAYIETADEDGIIGDRMDRGRQALARRGATDAGPYLHPLETGLAHFHQFLRDHIS